MNKSENVDKKQTVLIERRKIEKDEIMIQNDKKEAFYDGVRAIGICKSYDVSGKATSIEAL